MDEDLAPVFRGIADLFAGMPPAVFLTLASGLLGLALWALVRAGGSVRTVLAVARTPLADLRSMAGGRVRLRGTAQPGQSGRGVIWYSRSRRSGRDSSTLTTTDNFCIEDVHGRCAVQTARTHIVPTRSDHSGGFGGQRSSAVERMIQIGDPVFAIGSLQRDLPPLADVPGVHCRLVRAGGVLLVSGASEAEVRVLCGLWAVVQTVCAAACAAVLALGVWAHLASYPPTDGSVLNSFVDALRHTPWQPEPGLARP